MLIKFADSYTGGTVWLKHWSEVNADTGRNPQIGKYLGIYFAFGFGSSALVIVQTLILWIFCSIEVCTILRTRFMVVQPSRIATFHPIQYNMRLMRNPGFYLGFPQVARKNGICHISVTNEFL